MAREQFGICAEANLHGFMFLINALDGHQGTLRVQLARLHSLIQRLSDQFSESNLSAVIAIGAGYWDTLYPAARPRDLQTFPPLIVDDLDMPASPYDLFLQIRSDRYDVLHLAAQQCMQLLQPYIEIQEQVHAFRYMDGRDLTGFIDQPRAPKGKRKRELALVAEEVEPEFSGGSYLHFQRYRLDLNRWQQLTQQQQEIIIGQRKLDGQQLPMAQLSEQSHAVKAAVTDVFGEFYPLVFQNMPFGQLKAQGLVILACSAEPKAYLAWLNRRLGDAGGQNYDLLLDYVQADSGAAFFAPSISFLEDQADL